MKYIKLTKGFKAIVDDEDYDRVSQYNWCALITGSPNLVYAVANINGKPTKLHRFIMHPPKNKAVSFIKHHSNRKIIDHRKQNLRIATYKEAIAYKRKQLTYADKPTTSKYKGVSWNKNNKAWQVRITVNKQTMFLGYFDNEKEAAQRYLEYAKIHFGNLTNTMNQPKPHKPDKHTKKQAKQAREASHRKPSHYKGKKPTSQYKGVTWNRASQKWQAYYHYRDPKTNKYKNTFLGLYDSEQKAAQIAKKYRNKHNNSK